MSTQHDDRNHVTDHGGDRPSLDRWAPPALLTELREHIPFSVTAVAIGLIIAGSICVLGFGTMQSFELPAHAGEADHEHGHSANPTQPFFHLFHPAHMLFSAIATAAMFCRYERKVAKAIVIGLIGAIGVCGISDIAMPHVSLLILGAHTPWHICVYEHPGLVLPFAVIGVLVGVAASGGVTQSTLISHSLHVLMSTMASIFYMVGPLGVIDWIDDVGKVFVFVVLAVMIPCCVSDIVFPLLMSKGGRERFEQEPHPH